jgi:hypothetical protein
MKTEDEIRKKLKDNKYKIFPRDMGTWQEGYVHALEWILGED